MVDGKRGKFDRMSLTLKNGETKRISLTGEDDIKIILPISYRNGILSVAGKSVQYKYDKSWKKGKTFKISTQGASRLKNMKLTVVAI